MSASDAPTASHITKFFGILLLSMGGVFFLVAVITYFVSGQHDYGAAAVKALPVARTPAELRAAPQQSDLIVEGRLLRPAPQAAANDTLPLTDRQTVPLHPVGFSRIVPSMRYPRNPAAPASPDVDTAAQLGLLAWQKDRFNYQETHAGSGNPEYWYPELGYFPPVMVHLGSGNYDLTVVGCYLLSGPLRQAQSDTPAVRPSPRAGLRGTWRYIGLPAGALVTVRGSHGSPVSRTFAATEVYAGSVADYYLEKQREGRENQDMAAAMMGAGLFFMLVGALVWWVGRALA